MTLICSLSNGTELQGMNATLLVCISVISGMNMAFNAYRRHRHHCHASESCCTMHISHACIDAQMHAWPVTWCTCTGKNTRAGRGRTVLEPGTVEGGASKGGLEKLSASDWPANSSASAIKMSILACKLPMRSACTTAAAAVAA